MRDRRVGTRYAQALVTAAKAAKVLPDVADSYAGVVELMKGKPALVAFLEGPQVAEVEKKDLLNSLFTQRVEPVLLRFFHLLIDKNRIEYLVEIGERFATLVEKEQGYAHAVVVTAVTLPADLEQALIDKLVRLTGAKIVLEKKVNPAVIGGVRVTVGDQVVDGTVRTQLDQLREHLSRTPLR